METLNAIEGRRSIRKYTEKKLDKKIIEDILNCGRLAPSAKNRQPWYFVIVTDEIKDKIVNLMINYAETSLDEIDLVDRNTIIPTANVIKQSPTLILIFREKNDKRIIEDCLGIGACIQNMCLRATDLSIGSLWIRDVEYISEIISKLIGLDNLELNCALSLGYADQTPKMRPRKELKDITKWY